MEVNGYAEYILPCVVNVLSEDDVILEFNISTNDYVSMIYLFGYFNVSCIHFILTLKCIIVIYRSLLGLFVFGRKVTNYAK